MSETVQPNVPLQPEPKPGPGPQPPRPVAWEMDPDKHAIPNAPVSGTLAGAAFVPEVVLEGPELKFRVLKAGTPNAERQVTIRLPKPAEGRTFKVKPDMPNSPELPKIFTEYPPPAPGKSSGSEFPGSHALYALTLELGSRKDGKVTGRIYLAMEDEAKSALAGTFTANYLRPMSEPPGPDDMPFAYGDVTVIGAKLDTAVRVTYAGFTANGLIIQEVQMTLARTSEEPVGWALEDNNKPRVSILYAGDGKARPSRYEHVKLVPGRYLLAATVAGGGPVVWKWVEVPANGMLTENFTLDLTKTGGLEINAPRGSTGQALLAPADDATRPPIDATQFFALAVQMRLTADTVAGKAVYKNLAPGKYEARIDGERRTVDVVAGKTAELDFTPKK